MDTSAIDMVTEDNDGEIPAGDNHNWIVDISHLLSEQLGKQMPMMATYRVKGLHLSLRNVNNTADNDSALLYGGTVNWYSPTKHRIDALQHARTYKRQHLSIPSELHDPFSQWSDDKKYKGLRFNWAADTDSVSGALTDDTTVLAGTEFSLKEIFDHYNQAIGGNPINEGYDEAAGEGDALWNTRVGLEEYDGLYFVTSFRNRIQTGSGTTVEHHNPESMPWEWQSDSNHLAVLGGLISITGVQTSTDAPGFVEDEYYIQCSVMVEGWEEF